MRPLALNGYLLDTSVLSAFAPDKPTLSPELAAWLRARSDRLFVPCITIAELEQGICKLRRAGGEARADRLARWMDGLVDRYAERILPLDTGGLPNRRANRRHGGCSGPASRISRCRHRGAGATSATNGANAQYPPLSSAGHRLRRSVRVAAGLRSGLFVRRRPKSTIFRWA